MSDSAFTNAISTVVLLAATACYREGYTPPTPQADDSIRVKQTTKRLLPMVVSRVLATLHKNIVTAHLLLEIFALWFLPKSPQLEFKSSLTSICPLATSSFHRSAFHSIHPHGKLPPTALIGLSLIIFGGLTRGSCHRRLGKLFTWEASIHKDHTLITSGPYQYVRHPAYSGLILVGMGYSIFLWSAGTFGKECFIGSGFPPAFNTRSIFGIVFASVLMCLYLETDSFLVRRSFEEDKMMKGQFGREWDEWASQVRWNVVPFVI